ncbi:MAG: lipid A biosynthesis (KDO)2-(lauroyl)-lipid IVA acyltransferase [Bacteroidales bacterium]|jgi:predicted LPLAT superfamily acyltransferase|nr:lipid A biosynthesis (KDO)2-(lauroyl)-lipid IVA acyltransferase [Bacteroidales bacterium]
MDEVKKKVWSGVTGGKKLGQKALLFLFHFFSVTIGYFILIWIVPFYMLFGTGYKPTYQYFRHHHGYSPRKAFFKTYRNHFIFGQCMLDKFAVYAGRKNFFTIKTTGNELFYRLLEEEKGFIIASSHLGNFELCGYLLKQDKKRINALAFGGETKEVMNNRIKWFALNNVNVIPIFEDISYLFTLNNVLTNGEIVSVSCDRSMGFGKTLECDFLEGKVDFPMGTFSLAVHYDIPILSVFVIKESVSVYNVYVKEIGGAKCEIREERKEKEVWGREKGEEKRLKEEKAELLTQKFVKELEIMVRKYPEQWFNYYDFWK